MILRRQRCFSTVKGLLLAIVLAIPAQSQPCFAQGPKAAVDGWEKVLTAAEKEGSVVVAGPSGSAIRNAITQGFSKAFPKIKLQYIGGRGGQLASRIRAERQGGIYSVDVLVQGTTTALIYFKPMGALNPVHETLILPAVKDTKYWQDDRLEFADKDRNLNLVFAVAAQSPIVYNLDQVKPEEIDELSELLNPKWKGKFLINDPIPSGSGNVTFRFIWQALGRNKAPDYFMKLREHAATVDRDERRMIEWIASGKYGFNLGSSGRITNELLDRGLKFGVLAEFEDHGTYVSPGPSSLALFNRAPHPNAAAVFINWLLTKEAQTAWSKASGFVSRRSDVPTDHLPSYVVPKPGRKYWSSYLEEYLHHSPEEEKVLKEIFG